MTATKIRGGYQPRSFDCEGVQQAEILEKTGITYRQLDFWTSSKRITCHYHVGGKILHAKGGSGSTACWMPDQVKIIGRVAALLRRGFELGQSFDLATNFKALMGAMAELTYIEADLLEQKERTDREFVENALAYYGVADGHWVQWIPDGNGDAHVVRQVQTRGDAKIKVSEKYLEPWRIRWCQWPRVSEEGEEA